MWTYQQQMITGGKTFYLYNGEQRGFLHGGFDADKVLEKLERIQCLVLELDAEWKDIPDAERLRILGTLNVCWYCGAYGEGHCYCMDNE